MLKRIMIQNFALIEKVEIDFVSGLNCFTGETGAGKSILIDALGVILGDRVSLSMIRTSAEYFRIEGVFDITSISKISLLLEEKGIEIDPEGDLVISRKFTLQGKNQILINGCTVSLAFLRTLGELLVDMHGQHDNQALLRSDSYQSLLDSFLEVDARSILKRHQDMYREWCEARRHWQELHDMGRERLLRIDTLSWQVQEIKAAKLQIGEDQELEEKLRVATHGEKINKVLQHVFSLLTEGNEKSGMVAQLAIIVKELESLTKYMRPEQLMIDVFRETLYQIQEAETHIYQLIEKNDYDPMSLEQMQKRMDEIYRLKRKYGSTIDEILQFQVQTEEELAQLGDNGFQLEALAKKISQLEYSMEETAAVLTKYRKETARRVSTKTTEHLQDLSMPQARFQIEVLEKERWDAQGKNEIIFLFSANQGEELFPLHKVASGGELSRIALALKTQCVGYEGVGTMIFDEIDAGIGGQTAQKVAEKVAWVAMGKQVLCITHLPQLACMADLHLYIEKYTKENRTVTSVIVLNEKDRPSEIARMFAGDQITPIALANAEQLLQTAWEKKIQMKEIIVQ